MNNYYKKIHKINKIKKHYNKMKSNIKIKNKVRKSLMIYKIFKQKI